jgi:hypothetical protein
VQHQPAMSFFGRVMNYVFNEVLVNTLANRWVLLVGLVDGSCWRCERMTCKGNGYGNVRPGSYVRVLCNLQQNVSTVRRAVERLDAGAELQGCGHVQLLVSGHCVLQWCECKVALHRHYGSMHAHAHYSMSGRHIAGAEHKERLTSQASEFAKTFQEELKKGSEEIFKNQPPPRK